LGQHDGITRPTPQSARMPGVIELMCSPPGDTAVREQDLRQARVGAAERPDDNSHNDSSAAIPPL